jgi:hypothetical protein
VVHHRLRLGARAAEPGNPSESQSYQPSAVTAANGQLVLTATKQPQTVEREDLPVHVRHGHDVRQGGVLPGAVRPGHLRLTYATLPMTPGMWPAIWLLPQDYTWPPEVDLMEAWGDHPGRHPQRPLGRERPSGADRRLAEHRRHLPGPDRRAWLRAGWTSSYLSFHVDGVEVQRITDPAAVPSKPMYLLINLAVEGAKVTPRPCSREDADRPGPHHVLSASAARCGCSTPDSDTTDRKPPSTPAAAASSPPAEKPNAVPRVGSRWKRP